MNKYLLDFTEADWKKVRMKVKEIYKEKKDVRRKK